MSKGEREMTSKEALEIIGHIDIDGRYPYPNYLKDRYKKEYEVLEQLVKMVEMKEINK